MIEPATRKPLRWAMTAFQGLRRAFWFFGRPTALGAHGVPLTPAGKVVLVKLRYAPGWRLPGGGRSPDEEARAAALRELEEEIGMTAHGAVELIGEIEHEPDFRRATSSVFLVRDVVYRPRWSLEVEAVTEAAPEALPADMPDQARQWIEMAMKQIGA